MGPPETKWQSLSKWDQNLAFCHEHNVDIGVQANGFDGAAMFTSAVQDADKYAHPAQDPL
jgi:hypothetical protein